VPPEVERRFERCKDALFSFARTHDCDIGTYLKDIPAWHFVFGHPRGGEARVDLFMKNMDEFYVVGIWQVADYANGELATKSLIIQPEEYSRDAVLARLEAMLAQVVAWTEKNMDRVVNRHWSRWWSRDQFAELPSQKRRPVRP
jgi:hypothetical protein